MPQLKKSERLLLGLFGLALFVVINAGLYMKYSSLQAGADRDYEVAEHTPGEGSRGGSAHRIPVRAIRKGTTGLFPLSNFLSPFSPVLGSNSQGSPSLL